MATHSSVLAWRIPGTGEPGGLPSMGMHRVGHRDWFPCAGAVLSLAQTHRGRPQTTSTRLYAGETPWTAACQASLSITNSQGLLKLMFIESVMPQRIPEEPGGLQSMGSQRLELIGPCVVLGFSVDMEAFDELLSINVPLSQEFPGEDLELPM